MYFNRELVDCLSKGAQVLGGGGGGREQRGLKTAEEALAAGQVRLAGLEEMSPSDLVVTVSGVGAPSQSQAMYTARHYLRALELLEQRLDRPIAGFIPSEMGGSAAFGPFLAAAVKGIPVVNAACDGRTHPLGTMGALGLDKDPNCQTLQAACGGRQEEGTYIELVTCGTVRSASRASRLAAELAGGLAAVVRNPVSAEYLQKNAAMGCYTMAIDLGRALLAENTAQGKADAAARVLGGEVLCRGEVTDYRLFTAGGLDHGSCTLSAGGEEYRLYFYNEYMAVQRGEERLATFPDLIATLDGVTGESVLTADLAVGRQVILVRAPHNRLILGAGLRQRKDYEGIEELLGISMIPFLQDLLET